MRKTWRRIFWCLAGLPSVCWLGGTAWGQAELVAPQYPQYVQYPQGAPPVTPAVAGAQVNLAAYQLDQLLGPIALYPDPLLSMVFPASTYPQEVVASEEWLQNTPDLTEAAIAAQSWDGSIKGLVHYPTVLKMMSDRIDWTQAVGAAFVNQQKDVLNSVQRLRAQAQAAQNLQTTAQEQVLADGNDIRIEPVDPDTMYVPQYDPNLVYSSPNAISFGVGYPIGLWCDDDFNWGQGYIVSGGGWYMGWHHPLAWDQHPPAWNRRPAGWVGASSPWVRNNSRPAPRLMPAAVAHLGLDRPRGAPGVNPGIGVPRGTPAPPSLGRQPVPVPSRSAFEPSGSRADVQAAQQRARQPAPTIRPPMNVQPRVAPRPAPAAPAPRASVPRQSAPSSAFRGGSAGPARAASSRGNASAGHR